MRNCPSCQSDLPENARFCPQCGEKVFEETLTCPDCGAENAINSKFCFHCGMMFFQKPKEPKQTEIEFEIDPPTEPKEPELVFESAPEVQEESILNDIFEETPVGEIEKEIFQKFNEAFKERIKAEHNIRQLEDYSNHFNNSGFKKAFDYRVNQLAEQVQNFRKTGQKEQEEALLNKAFNESLDYFIIYYCKEINEIELPEAILKYQNIKPENLDLAQMILDYLDFENEEETVYLDFITMPIQKLKNAGKSFLFPKKDEKILFICDQSVLGSCKEGFAMTERGIYWKAHFEKPQSALYSDLNQIERQEDWLNINGIFFNVNQSLNLKLLKLLKILRELS